MGVKRGEDMTSKKFILTDEKGNKLLESDENSLISGKELCQKIGNFENFSVGYATEEFKSEENVKPLSENYLYVSSDSEEAKEEFVGLTEELHQRLHVQARNLLLEYRLSPTKSVPVEKVEDLMRIYGNLIAKLIWEKQKDL